MYETAYRRVDDLSHTGISSGPNARYFFTYETVMDRQTDRQTDAGHARRIEKCYGVRLVSGDEFQN